MFNKRECAARGAPAPLKIKSPSPNKILQACSNAEFGEGDTGGEA